MQTPSHHVINVQRHNQFASLESISLDLGCKKKGRGERKGLGRTQKTRRIPVNVARARGEEERLGGSIREKASRGVNSIHG